MLMDKGFITPVSLHYVRNHGAVPKLDWDSHKVKVNTARFTQDIWEGCCITALCMLEQFLWRGMLRSHSCAGVAASAEPVAEPVAESNVSADGRRELASLEHMPD